MREVLRRTPTYMMLDDHEVADDWGVINNDAAWLERVDRALQAYRLFQRPTESKYPLPPFHYSFRRGFASFFILDCRSVRGKDSDFPILDNVSTKNC